MRMVSDHRAEWLPSRHHYALAKLIAFCIFRAKRAEAAHQPARFIFPINDYQSAAESFLVAGWMFLTAVVELAALLPFRPWISATIAVLTVPWLLQIPLFVLGSMFGNRALTSITTFTILAIASAFVAVMPTAVRYSAWFFFAVLAANALAWPVVRLLREPMTAMERQCDA
jgi:hypothetical protein